MTLGFGEPIQLTSLEEVTSDQDPSVGQGWEVSEETRSQIREIEASIRSSEERTGSFLVG